MNSKKKIGRPAKKKSVGRPPKKKENRGRPKAISLKEIEKLEQAFSIGCSVREALVFANVKESTYYDYTRDNHEFSARIALLKEKMPLKARTVIYDALNNSDVNTAKWLLERVKSDEFSISSKVDHTTNGDKIESVQFYLPENNRDN